jgi:hypothetical protein
MALSRPPYAAKLHSQNGKKSQTDRKYKKKIKGNRYGSGEMGIQISRVMRQNEVILFPMKEENRYCAVWCLLYRFQTTALGESG